MKKNSIASALPLLALLAMAPAQAADERMSWTGGSNNWNNPNSWFSFGGPGAGAGIPGWREDVGDLSNVIMQTGSVTTTVNADFTPAFPFDILLIRGSQNLNIAANFDLTGIPTWLAQTAGTHDLNHTAGTFTSGSLTIGGGAGANGTYTLSGGALSVVGNNNLVVGNGGGGNAIFDQTAGNTTVAGNLTIGTAGAYNLDGGSLGVNTINVDPSGSFNWGDGTLTAFSNSADGAVDQTNPGFTEVFSGRTITVNGNVASSAGQDGTLALGGIYLNSGKRFNQLSVSGSLDLTGGSDTLDFAVNPYLLRPNIGAAEDFGSLTLVEAGNLDGTFDVFDSVLSDGIGWTEYTGAFTSASALPLDTYFLEQTTGASGSVIFHYKVSGSVPEPGTMGFLLIGVVLVRRLRWMKEKVVEQQRTLSTAFSDDEFESALPEALASGDFYK